MRIVVFEGKYSGDSLCFGLSMVKGCKEVGKYRRKEKNEGISGYGER